MIGWFTRNGIAANFLMILILVAGGFVATTQVPLEVTPALSWDGISIRMAYRGATGKDVERAILIPIEEALEGVEGIDSIKAEGFPGGAWIWVRAARGKDRRELLDDIKGRVDTITTFPAETEPPRIYIPESAHYYEILEIAVTGDLAVRELRDVAIKVQRDLLEMPGISRVVLQGDLDPEIGIETDVEKLLAYGLSFQELADAIRAFSIDLPAGAIDSDSGTFIVRTDGQAFSRREFEQIPVRSVGGAEIRVGDVAKVTDGFSEDQPRLYYNGRPALLLEVMRVSDENALEIAKRVREYIAETPAIFPEGIRLEIWDDQSIAIRQRLSTLSWALALGGLFVLVILGLFVRPAVAFWIVIGIPVSFAGAAIFMPWFGLTANVMSLFGFIIVTGIVVDDAIVTAEHIYCKISEGKDPLHAAIQGTKEIATPVTFGALTTIVAFVPMMFFDGNWGDYARQVPPIVTMVLLFSLVESKLILPAHLKHLRYKRPTGLFSRFQSGVSNLLQGFIERVYAPVLRMAIRGRWAVIASFVSLALVMAGYCISGRMKFVPYPTVDTTRISAMLSLPSDTPMEVTQRYVQRITDALHILQKEAVDPVTGESMVGNIVTLAGASRPGRDYDRSRAYASFEVLPPEQRSEPGPSNTDLATRWSELVGEIPEAREFRTRTEAAMVREWGPDDDEFNLELRGPDSPAKREVARKIKSLLETYPGLKDQWTDVDEGQDELRIRLKSRAAELGLTQSMLASQVRQAFYGEEAQRFQRGTDDVRVMVRLPESGRRSLHTLDRLKIRTPSGAEVPLKTVATITVVKAPSNIERTDKAEVARIGANVRDESVDMVAIARDLGPTLEKLCNSAGLTFRYDGYVADAEATRRQTIIGAILLGLTLYGLLAVALRSLLQPLYVLLAVPFAVIGAIFGHILLDLTPSYLSVFGMLALAGIAVNDTLVLVDFINRRCAAGTSLFEAVAESGTSRFRPIFLTSVTTFVGLTPLIFDPSIQAKFLIPMAVSLAFGVLFATGVTLFLVPCAVLAGDDISRGCRSFSAWYATPFKSSETVTKRQR
ncbi:MAG: efflux RND transporter permease subunit [Rubripirellula sp.]|nr:efflux RND transporter permease subunit [Rubripirellula sp.]